MRSDIVDQVRQLAPDVGPTGADARVTQRAKLADAIARSTHDTHEARAAEIGHRDATRPASPRRRAMAISLAAVAVFGTAIAIVIPALLGAGHAPRVGASRGAPVVMELASVRLRLPSSYRLDATPARNCPVGGVGFAAPSGTTSSSVGTTSTSAHEPTYAPAMQAAATAQGGCVFMVLAPPYTPTTADPDPESGTFEGTPPVQVGPYEGRVGTWETVAKPSGTATVQAVLFVELPAAHDQHRDLVVSANGLSISALVSLVANGLTVTGD